MPLLPLAKLKPAFVVRTPGEFQTQFLIWIAVYLAAFHAVFLIWRWSAFRGDFAMLPAIHLLTGIGLILAVSLRDPLRDTLEFSKFAWGVALGCLVLLAAVAARLQLSALLGLVLHAAVRRARAFCVADALRLGPGGNDAKVNLGPFQPVEVIKILLVFFLAGYSRAIGSGCAICGRSAWFHDRCAGSACRASRTCCR